MIGIIGNMSGGKSYSAVRIILDAFQGGHVVVTNIELDISACADYLGCAYADLRPFYWRIRDDDDDLGEYEVHASDYESWPAGSLRGTSTYESDLVLIVLDEASSIFDAMTSGASAEIKKVASWARHTEKRGQMVYLIMQFENELHKRLRNHITQYIFCKNMSKVVVPIIRCHLPKSLFGFITQIHLMPDGETTLGTPDFVPLDSRVFRCYRTAQIVVGSQRFVRPAVPAISADNTVIASSVKTLAFAFLVLLLTSGCILCRLKSVAPQESGAISSLSLSGSFSQASSSKSSFLSRCALRLLPFGRK